MKRFNTAKCCARIKFGYIEMIKAGELMKNRIATEAEIILLLEYKPGMGILLKIYV